MTTVHLLQAFPDVAEHYRRRFRHVLVDEYQDTNHAQYALVRELVGRPTPSCAGRRRRPSCAWSATPTSRSTPSAARRSATSWSSSRTTRDARTILLEQNYRSTQTILSAANAVIARNTDRTRRRTCGPTRATASRSSATSPTTSTTRPPSWRGEIDRLGDDGEVRPGDVAVFYRTNAQSRVFEEVFIRVGLPYKVVGGIRFYERTRGPGRAGLPAGARPTRTTRCSLRRILNVPKRGIGDRAEGCVAALRRARADLVRRGAARGRRGAPGIATRSQRRDRRRSSRMLDELRDAGRGRRPPAEVLEAVLHRTGYLAELEASDDPQDETRVENLAELVSVAREYARARPRRRPSRPRRRCSREPPTARRRSSSRSSLVADADADPRDDDGQPASSP